MILDNENNNLKIHEWIPKDILAKLKRGDQGSLNRLKQNIKTGEKYQLNNFDQIAWFWVS